MSEGNARQSSAMDIVFVIDTTDSMETLIQAFEQKNFTIDDKCGTLSERIKFNYGIVIFKNPIMFIPYLNEYI